MAAFVCPQLEADATRRQDIYELLQNDCDSRAILAAAYREKEFSNSFFLKFPIGITLEAEAFGAEMKFDAYGRRIDKNPYASLENFLNGAANPYASPRVQAVLAAVREASIDEPIIFHLSGAFSVLERLVGCMYLCRAVRRSPRLVHESLKKINSWLVFYALSALKKESVRIISFSDTGCMGMISRKDYREFSAYWQLKLFAAIKPHLRCRLVHICGMTSSRLEQSKVVETRRMATENKLFAELLLDMAEREDVYFCGHSCIRHEHCRQNYMNVLTVKEER